MGKTSKSDNDGYKTVLYEIYHGGYVTSDDKVAPSNYLVHLPSHNDVIVNIDVKEELNDMGNCGDSDDDSDDARNFDDTMKEVGQIFCWEITGNSNLTRGI